MDYKENAIEWLNGFKQATVSLNSQRMISRVRRLAKQHPDDVEIVAINQDGSMTAHIPVKWIKINPPRQVSEKQLQNLADARQKKSENFSGSSEK